MATTGSGYVRPAMPMPPEASPNHCSPQPPILRNRGASVSSASAASLASSDSTNPPQTVAADTYILGTDRLTQDGSQQGPGGHARPRRLSAVHFAPLPVVPPELKRRSSITLGVAARKNLLISQNGGSKPKTGVVYMTDEEWEDYKRQYEAKPDADVVDLGEMVSTGVRSLWKKVKTASSERRGSNSSVGSTSSMASSSAVSNQYRTIASPGPKAAGLLPVKEEHSPVQSPAPSAVPSPEARQSKPLPRDEAITSDRTAGSGAVAMVASSSSAGDAADQSPQSQLSRTSHGEARDLSEQIPRFGTTQQSRRDSNPNSSAEAAPEGLGTSMRFGNPPYRFGLKRTPSDSKYGASARSKDRNEEAVLGFHAGSHRPSTELLQNMVRDVRI